MDSFIEIINSHIDFNQQNFRDCIVLTSSTILFWIIVPFLEYHTKIMTKIIGNDRAKAADFFAYALIHLGAFKNYAFTEAMMNNAKYDFGGFNPLVQYAGYFLFLLFAYIFMMAATQLGLRGMYYGDHFGFLLEDKLTGFPFKYMYHPQYISIIGMQIAGAMVFRSPAGLVLTLISFFCYCLLAIRETFKLKKLYDGKKRD